jgi:hypothetical protein
MERADWDDGSEVEGVDGRTRTRLVLMNCPFEVSWQTRKAAIVQRKGILMRQAAMVLDDPHVKLEPQVGGPYDGQYRAIGRAPDNRILTLAVDIAYPADDDNMEEVGIIRVYTVWLASGAEEAIYHDEQ